MCVQVFLLFVPSFGGMPSGCLFVAFTHKTNNNRAQRDFFYVCLIKYSKKTLLLFVTTKTPPFEVKKKLSSGCVISIALSGQNFYFHIPKNKLRRKGQKNSRNSTKLESLILLEYRLMPLVVYMRPVMVKIIVLEGYEDPIDHRRHICSNASCKPRFHELRPTKNIGHHILRSLETRLHRRLVINSDD